LAPRSGSGKEAVQLAAVAAATDVFVENVITPALAEPEGLPRLEALVEAWLAYVERRVFPGGCFMVATLSEYDSRPGPVRDALARARRGWLKALEREAAAAQAAGDVPAAPAASVLAFEIYALLAAANVARNLGDDTGPLTMARDLIALRLGTR
jgi:AcrR family transcriptional regulator